MGIITGIKKALFKEPLPSKINLLFTGCNLACPMCSTNSNSKEGYQILRDYQGASKKEMTLAEYKNFFDSIVNLGIRPIVSMGGGEPMIFKEIIPLLGYLTRQCKLRVVVTTNGTLFDDQMILKFIETGAGITISLDGMRESHEKIRGRGNFEKTVYTIKKFTELQQKQKAVGGVASLFALHQTNYRELEEVVGFLDSLNVRALTVSFLIFSSDAILESHKKWVVENGLSERFAISMRRGGIKDGSEFTIIDFDYLWKSISRIREKYKWVRFEPNFDSLDDIKRYFFTNDVMNKYFGMTCVPGKTNFSLLSNGDVLFFPGCFEIKCGNVREQSLEEIWRSPIYKEIRGVLSEKLSPICAHCCANRVEKH